MLHEGYTSGVGKVPIPVMHGMTVGELARYFNANGFVAQGKFQLLPPAPPNQPIPRGKIHTRGNLWSFTLI